MSAGWAFADVGVGAVTLAVDAPVGLAILATYDTYVKDPIGSLNVEAATCSVPLACAP